MSRSQQSRHVERPANPYLLLVLLAIYPLSGISIDIVVPSLPAIQAAFHLSSMHTQQLINIFLLGFGLSQIFVGPLSDKFGRRSIYLSSLFAYAITSAMLANTKSGLGLEIGRFVQGILIVTPVVLTKAIITDITSKHTRASATSLMVIAWAIGPVLGPFLGGYLQAYFGWQSIYYFLAGYAACAAFLVYQFLPETVDSHLMKEKQLLMQMYKQMLLQPRFLQCAFLLCLGNTMTMIYYMMGPFIVQNTLKHSAIFFGNSTAVLGLMCVLGALMNLVLLKYFSAAKITRNTLIFILGVCIAYYSFLLIAPLTIYNLLAFVGLLFLGVCLYYPNVTADYLTLYESQAGAASSLCGSIVMIGSASLCYLLSIITTSQSQTMILVLTLTSISALLINLGITTRKNKYA